MPPALTLRRYSAQDAPALNEALMESREEMIPWMTWFRPDYGLKDSESWIAFQVRAFDLAEEFSFSIRDAEDRLLGGCGLNKIDRENRVANLGYWVRSSCTCRGIASEAVRQLCVWAYDKTLLNRLEIVASVHNAASLRVAAKCGAHREAVLRAKILLHGEHHDAVMHSILRNDGPHLRRTS